MLGAATGVLASRDLSGTLLGVNPTLVPMQYYGEAATLYREFVNPVPLNFVASSTTLFRDAVTQVPLGFVGTSTTLFSTQVNTVPLNSA